MEEGEPRMAHPGRESGRLMIALPATAVLCMCALLVLHALTQAPATLAGQVVLPDGSRPAPRFILQDQAGRAVTPGALRGRVTVITFLDSHCTQDCPVIGRELALVDRRVGTAVPWTLLVVSVAPLNDTPASSAAFALESGWHMDWRWLFGTPTQLARVWSDYGIWVHPTPKDILHTAALYVVGPDGSVRVADMLPFSPDQLVQTIRALAPRAQAGWLDRLLHR